ncbi:MAG TPA: hypothetical protein ENF87_00640 [Thermoproteales archaeon]|nr:hypothetical protein [Thermoproteales archaeon]
MPLVCKIFKLNKPLELNLIAEKLHEFTQTYTERINSKEVELGYRVRELSLREDIVEGVFEDSFLIEVYYRGEFNKVPVSRDTRFFFIKRENDIYLVIGDKKFRANRLANIFSEILFAKRGEIIEAQISHETLKALHESNPSSSKVIFFDNVVIPNVEKLALYGPGVADASLYSEYLKYGKIWYVVFTVKKGWVVGITRNCVITSFSRVSEEDFYSFVINEVLNLVE